MPTIGAQRDRDRTDHDAVLNLVIQRVAHSVDAFSEKRSDLLDYFKSYRAYRKDPVYPWTSNMVLPVVFDTIETFMPHLISEDMTIRALPRSGADPEKTNIWDALLAYDLDRARFIWKMAIIAKSALIYGFCPFEVGWLKNEKLMSIRDFKNIKLPFSDKSFRIPMPKEKRRQVLFDGPVTTPIDVFNFFPQPGYDNVNSHVPSEGMSWCGNRFVVPLKWLEARKHLLNDGAIKRIRDTSFPEISAPGSDEASEMEERLSIMGINTNSYDPTMEQVEIIAMHGDRGPNEKEDGVIWLANRQNIIRNEGSPFFHGMIPFGVVNDIFIPGTLCGIGEAEIAQNFQIEKSDLRNARMDNVNQVVNRMWKYLRGTGVDFSEMVSRPGGLIGVDHMEDIQELRQGEVPFSTYREEETLDQDIQRMTGALDVLRGLGFNVSRETATGANIKGEFAAARVRSKLFCMKLQGMQQIGRWFIQLEQQFTTKKKSIRIARDPSATEIVILPEDIAGEWDVVPVLDQTLPMTRAQKRQDAIAIYQQLMPMVQQGVVVADKLVMELLEAHGVVDSDKFLISHQQAAAQLADPKQLAKGALGAEREASGDPLLSVLQGGGAP
jgi:hypothetical protein|tara:strand:+ start:2394 stop:4220 length:1827 start_codon:yes stop_codon:yes gene_type:complete